MKQIYTLLIAFLCLCVHRVSAQVSIPYKCSDGSTTMHNFPSYEQCPCRYWAVDYYKCNGNTPTSIPGGMASSETYEGLMRKLDHSVFKADEDCWGGITHHTHSAIYCNDPSMCDKKPSNTNNSSSNSSSSHSYSTPSHTPAYTPPPKNIVDQTNDRLNKQNSDMLDATNKMYRDMHEDELKAAARKNEAANREMEESAAEYDSKKAEEARQRADIRKEVADANSTQAGTYGSYSNSSGPKLVKANSKMNSGDYDGALRDLNDALRLDPGSADINNMIGLILFKQGHYADAAKYFHDAMQHSPADESETIRKNQTDSYMRAGEEALRTGTQEGYEQALAYYKQAAEADPDDADALNNIAYTYDKMGNADKAKEYYIKAAAKGSPNAIEWCNYNNIDYKKPQQAKATEAKKPTPMQSKDQTLFPKPSKWIPSKGMVIPNGGSMEINCVIFSFEAHVIEKESCMPWEPAYHYFHQEITVTNNSKKAKIIDDGSGMQVLTGDGSNVSNLHFSGPYKPGQSVTFQYDGDCYAASELKGIAANSGVRIRNAEGHDDADDGCHLTPKAKGNCGNKYNPNCNGWNMPDGDSKRSHWESKMDGNTFHLIHYTYWAAAPQGVMEISDHSMNSPDQCLRVTDILKSPATQPGEFYYHFAIDPDPSCHGESIYGYIRYLYTFYNLDGSIRLRFNEAGTHEQETTVRHAQNILLYFLDRSEAEEIQCHLKKLFGTK